MPKKIIISEEVFSVLVKQAEDFIGDKEPTESAAQQILEEIATTILSSVNFGDMGESTQKVIASEIASESIIKALQNLFLK